MVCETSARMSRKHQFELYYPIMATTLLKGLIQIIHIYLKITYKMLNDTSHYVIFLSIFSEILIKYMRFEVLT
jgi:hypothetical protein